jgi:hypothetical protein
MVMSTMPRLTRSRRPRPRGFPLQAADKFFKGQKTSLHTLIPVGAAGTPHGCLVLVFGNLCGQGFETLHNHFTTHTNSSANALERP